MSNLEYLQAYLSKYHYQELDIEHIVRMLITSPHAWFNVAEYKGEIIGGLIGYSFKEMGLLVLAAFDADDLFAEQKLMDDAECYTGVFSPYSLPDGTKFAENWYGLGTKQDAMTALFLYYVFALRVPDPTQDDRFLATLKEVAGSEEDI